MMLQVLLFLIKVSDPQLIPIIAAESASINVQDEKLPELKS